MQTFYNVLAWLAIFIAAPFLWIAVFTLNIFALIIAIVLGVVAVLLWSAAEIKRVEDLPDGRDTESPVITYEELDPRTGEITKKSRARVHFE